MDYTLIPVWFSVIAARLLSLHHCRDAAISHRMAPDSPHVSASQAEKVGMIEPGSPTTFCLEFGFCSSHSMSRELDDGNWWWHGKVALSPTTLFISVWAAAGSRLSRTEEEKETQMSDQDAGSEKNKNKPSRKKMWRRRKLRRKDAARDVTQNLDRYLMAAEMQQTLKRDNRGFFFSLRK